MFIYGLESPVRVRSRKSSLMPRDNPMFCRIMPGIRRECRISLGNLERSSTINGMTGFLQPQGQSLNFRFFKAFLLHQAVTADPETPPVDHAFASFAGAGLIMRGTLKVRMQNRYNYYRSALAVRAVRFLDVRGADVRAGSGLLFCEKAGGYGGACSFAGHRRKMWVFFGIRPVLRQIFSLTSRPATAIYDNCRFEWQIARGCR